MSLTSLTKSFFLHRIRALNKSISIAKKVFTFSVFVIISLTIASCGTTTVTHTAVVVDKNVIPIIKRPILVAHTSDGTVSYRTDGAGSPLVLIMGYSGSMDAWMPTFVDTLAKYHEVIIFDNAGIGQTSMPNGTLTIGKMAQQTNALIRYLHLNKPDVLGWSMGGMIAQALAINYPNDVNHLILAATLPGNGHATSPSMSTVAQLTNTSASNALNLLNLLFPKNQSAWTTKYIEALSKFPNFYVADKTVTTAQFNALALWSFAKDPSGFKLKSIKAQTLIADGSDDQLIPQANSKYMHSAIKNSKLIFYPDAGHGFLFQDQNKFIPLLLNFLNNNN